MSGTRGAPLSGRSELAHAPAAAPKRSAYGVGMEPVAEKQQAGRIADAGTGVVPVRYLLQIVPENRRKAVDVADDQLEDQVDVALGRRLDVRCGLPRRA